VVGDILQPTHLLFVLVVALLVLGPKRLPEVGRSLGKGLRDFKSALGGEEQPPHAEVLHQTSAESTTTNNETAEHVS
jgi:sec-independent protein translocase protein TatA